MNPASRPPGDCRRSQHEGGQVTRAPDAASGPGCTLATEVAAYRTLLALLGSELRALVAADADAVRASSDEKSRQVDLLLQAAHERTDALRRAGYAQDSGGMVAWLADTAQPPAMHALWTELSWLAGRARAQNALNHRLIVTQQRHWDGALAALWQAAGVSTTTYGADGRAQVNPAHRTFAAI
jgi:flagellar biosynthesis/type III secretory pathway chaperone